MSFLSYVQGLWTPSTSSGPATDASSRNGGLPLPFAGSSSSSASAQQLGSGVWPLSALVKEEMKKGIRYNMKVILRGTRATGKSTLMAHLSGHPQPARYTPSTELMASTMRLQGEHCAPHEGTKVDMWEVVEESRQRSAASSSPNDRARVAGHIPSAQLHEALRVAADARLLDVYTGCQLVVFMIDPRQRASWEYAKQETLHVPPTCCVLYALNFADLEPFSASGGTVLPHEVQSWCTRSRRATTSVVHRMLEGRQAPAEFSVRPMMAVLSAQSGVGMLGVTRALHVACTLLRIATEEVRVQRLFGLLARQQAVPVVGGEAELTADTQSPATAAASTAGPGTNAGRAAEHPLRKRHCRRRSKLPICRWTQCVRFAEAAAATAPATPLPSTTGLRMEHRTKVAAAAGGTGGGGAAAAAQALTARSMTDAEAMRHFLGSSGSSASARSSTCSASTTSSSGAPAGRVNGKLDGYAAPQPRRPSHSPAAPPLRGEEHAALAEVDDAADVPEPHVAAAPVNLPAEEVVSVLAATMVHDAGRPADNFFADESDGEAAAGDDEDGGSATPTAAVGPGARTARPLETHRVARRGDTADEASAASAAAAAAGAAQPALAVEVSTLLAEMTAALTSEVPTDNASGAANAATAAAVPKKKKRSKRSANGAEDGQAERHQHHHRKRRGGSATADADAIAVSATDATEAEDDGSFELVLV